MSGIPAEWRLEFEKPATNEDTLRILGSRNDTVVEVFFQLPYGGMNGGGSVKRGNVEKTLQLTADNFRKMFSQLVYPTETQLRENAKDNADAMRSIASLHQIKADDAANLRYLETYGAPISAVRFKVLPEQEEAFLARWSQPVSSDMARFKVSQQSTNRIISPSFVNLNQSTN